MIFNLRVRPDRIGTEILSILFQFYYCFINNYYLRYDINTIKFKSSIFIKSIFYIIDSYNRKINFDNIIAPDIINIDGPGVTDMCYGMGMCINLIKKDMLSFSKKIFMKILKIFTIQIQIIISHLMLKIV